MLRRYVSTLETHDNTTFCLGIHKTPEKAVAKIMEHIWDFQLSYKEDGDIFKVSELRDMADDTGKYITVEFKKHQWDFLDEPYKDNYCILYGEEDEE